MKPVLYSLVCYAENKHFMVGTVLGAVEPKFCAVTLPLQDLTVATCGDYN